MAKLYCDDPKSRYNTVAVITLLTGCIFEKLKINLKKVTKRKKSMRANNDLAKGNGTTTTTVEPHIMNLIRSTTVVVVRARRYEKQLSP